MSQRQKEITEEQRQFITDEFLKNPKVNGAEVRRHYKFKFPNEPEMFGKKVQNLIQILRIGKSITKGDEFQIVTSTPSRLRKGDVCQGSSAVADHDSLCLDGSETNVSSLPVKLETGNDQSTAQS